jgi:hypothetical protein
MKYQNSSLSEQNLIGFGVVQPGDYIETDESIENPNFTCLDSQPTPPPVPAVDLPVETATSQEEPPAPE